MVVCCLYTGVAWGLCKHRSPDVLFLGDSGIDGWAAMLGSEFCTCGCADECVDATGSAQWKDVTTKLKSHGLTWSHMGMNSAPISELCCVLPLILMKNKPKKYIVLQAGANDLLWYPGVLLKLTGVSPDYPMCGLRYLMSHVQKYGQPGLKVVFAGDMVSPFVSCKCFREFPESVKESAGTVVAVEVPADALVSAEAADKFIESAAFTYTTTTNASAAYPNLIFLDILPAYEKLVEAKGNRKWIGGFEMTKQAYLHYNTWVDHVVSGKATSTAEPAPVTMERT